MAGCSVRAIHRAHESLFYAPLGYIGVRGELQEGHFYASPMVGLIHSFNKYGRPASLYDFIRSPVWVLCSALCLPPRLRVSRSTLLILTHRANYVNSRIQRLLLRILPTLAESITAPLGRWGMTG